MSRVIRSHDAKRDAAEIWSYVAAHNVAAADRLLEEFGEALETLADFPKMGQSRDELEPGLRSVRVGNYLLFYRHVKRGVRLARIIHGMRDLPSQFRR